MGPDHHSNPISEDPDWTSLVRGLELVTVAAVDAA